MTMAQYARIRRATEKGQSSREKTREAENKGEPKLPKGSTRPRSEDRRVCKIDDGEAQPDFSGGTEGSWQLMENGKGTNCNGTKTEKQNKEREKRD